MPCVCHSLTSNVKVFNRHYKTNTLKFPFQIINSFDSCAIYLLACHLNPINLLFKAINWTCKSELCFTFESAPLTSSTLPSFPSPQPKHYNANVRSAYSNEYITSQMMNVCVCLEGVGDFHPSTWLMTSTHCGVVPTKKRIHGCQMNLNHQRCVLGE